MTISIDFSSPDLDPRLSWLNSPAAATATASGLRVVPHVGDWWSSTANSSAPTFEKRRVDEAAPLLLISPATAIGGASDDGGKNNGNSGDFDAEASVACFHRRDYDQAGICVRASSTCWLKANVERMPDGSLVLACCVTNGGFSDLSCSPLDSRCCCGGGGAPSSSLSSPSLSSPPVAASLPSSSGSSAAGGIPGASAAIRLRVRRRGGDFSVEWAPPPPAPSTTTKTETEEKDDDKLLFTRFRLCRLHEDDGGSNMSSLRVGVYASAPVAAGFVALFRSFKVGPPESGPLL